MTRIIAGFAGSHRLAVPRSGTRPTSDRVREAVFSALDSRDLVRESTVLDLYAGSGALGLEAASRGAHSVILVEKNADAADVARKNAALILKAVADDTNPPQIDVVAKSVSAFLASPGGQFDIVFVDPPYDLSEDELTQTLTLITGQVASDAVLVIERSTRSPQPTLPPELQLDRCVNYGETTVLWVITR